jgi:hypothetical protein
MLDGDAPAARTAPTLTSRLWLPRTTAAFTRLVRHRDPVRERTLEITFSAGGAEAYVFTFR